MGALLKIVLYTEVVVILEGSDSCTVCNLENYTANEFCGLFNQKKFFGVAF